jgi:transposase
MTIRKFITFSILTFSLIVVSSWVMRWTLPNTASMPQFTYGTSNMKLRTITIDLAKNVFQVCGVNEHIKSQFNKKLKRNDLLDFMRQQSPTVVVMEACYSFHYWGREIAKLGHDIKLIPAQRVTPFVRGNKNDHNDAFTIAKASQRANIRFVPVKSEHRQ